jgi:glycosyltransferase involved in cell wall biosynthesis
MRVGLDIRPLMKEATGVGIYWKNLLASLAEKDDANEYYLFSCSLKERFDSKDIPPFRHVRFKDVRFPQKWLNLLWARWARPRLDGFFRTKLQLTHSPSPLLCPTNGKKIITVHDLFFADHPELADDEARTLFLPVLRKTLQQADAVVAVSAYVKEALMEKFSLPHQKISVIPHGVNTEIFHAEEKSTDRLVWDKYDIHPGYILFIGTGEPRKNLPRLLDAFALLCRENSEAALVIAGKPGKDTPVIKKRSDQHPLNSRVRLLPYVPADDIPSLYRGAGLFVFPSLCEGFGLPLLEAMASRIPVAASRAPAIPETAGKAALYFDPYSIEEMKRIIQQGLMDNEVRKNLIQAGIERTQLYSWKQAADLTKKLYEETAG